MPTSPRRAAQMRSFIVRANVVGIGPYKTSADCASEKHRAAAEAAARHFTMPRRVCVRRRK